MNAITTTAHEREARRRKAYRLATAFTLYVRDFAKRAGYPEPTDDEVVQCAHGASEALRRQVAEEYGVRAPSPLTWVLVVNILRKQAEAPKRDPFAGLPGIQPEQGKLRP